uniref:Uncharacterized protein n=1 Tax=Leviviridae sp. TaxID=2027243 RepID=A0A142D856_9VIRU|nr:hypothetical protein [Leviviridae sp.]
MYLNLLNINSGAKTSVEIPTTDNGAEFKALIPVLNTRLYGNVGTTDPLPAGASVSTLPITVVGTSEQTARGVRRVLVKVEMPYASLQKCSCESDSYTVDTAKSGDPITMHVVLTLPKQAGIDLQGSGEERDAVFNRIVMLQYILESLIRNQVGTEPLPEEVAGNAVKIGLTANLKRCRVVSGVL